MSEPQIIQGDARALDLPDNSVDLVVTSPPYFGLRDYGTPGQLGAEIRAEEYIADLVKCTAEMVRVLKPSGSIFVNLGDKYAGAPSGPRSDMPDGSMGKFKHSEFQTRRKIRHDVPTKSLMLLPERYRIACVDELGLIARAVLVWSKPNGLPESVTDRVRRSHEDWVHLTKLPKYFAAVDEIREPHKYPGDERWKRQAGGDYASGASGHINSPLNPLGKLPGSVWEIATQPLRVPAELGVDHYAAFPMEWPRRLILGWSPQGGTVLDPFGGTGTTALVAAMHGRQGISVDLSADYGRLAEWRVNDPKQRERASRPAGSKPARSVGSTREPAPAGHGAGGLLPGHVDEAAVSVGDPGVPSGCAADLSCLAVQGDARQGQVEPLPECERVRHTQSVARSHPATQAGAA